MSLMENRNRTTEPDSGRVLLPSGFNNNSANYVVPEREPMKFKVTDSRGSYVIYVRLAKS